jgi:hypothetical protein
MLAPLDRTQTFYDGNFLAVPEEKRDVVNSLFPAQASACQPK